MKARVAALATVVVTAAASVAAFAPGSASAQSSFPGNATFSGYSTGTVIHADALNVPNGPRIVDGEVAFSGEAANTAGLSGGVLNEMNQNVSPSIAGKNSYGRGTGLELGLGTTVPDSAKAANQAIIAGLAQQSAAPVDSFGATPDANGVVTKEVGPVPADPIAYASLLRGQAAARWNPNFCVIGAPLGYGLGFAADAQLLDTGTKNADGSLGTPVIAADTGTPTDRTVSQSKSFTYLRPEPDGTFAVVSETHETIAPITLFKGTANEIHIEAAGEWVLRTISTGKPGGSTVEYAPAGNPTATTPLLTIIAPPGGPNQAPQNIILKTQDLFGAGKLPIPLIHIPGVADIEVGENPRAISSDPDNAGPPVTSADGTTTAAAVDVVRVRLDVPDPAHPLADVRIGHMEAKSVAPAGGVDCPIPVTKTANPDPVSAGQPFTWTITIPSAADSLAGTDCDLTNIKAVDVAKVLSGSPVANVTSASNGGSISGSTVSGKNTVTTTWGNLGTYHPGGPPIVVTLSGNIPASSGAGVLQNTVNVTATLGNCKGGAAGQDLVGAATITGTANVTGAAVKGTAFVNGPNVKSAAVLPARLAETGQKDPWLPVLGGGLLLGALALMRSRRRLQGVPSETR
ncbi:MAG: LPXTG cell wall anchor domain-containing protein [Acidimicrobiia bacterium]|nr:LPXTG cell wall anchor domain-containing protein [Acidimicrobiia bacterium]